ncbi:hypothetical protein L596_013398 [Steinernema carpocapsae]|uniref:Major facilitator superfamily (MFS) profile domain-containing protein n=1 Tax=Steinernema carpocapsae TaxID=34508 RepID=A0A4U5P015_STECR|nr:hypothetical protein L596_013398 [Steinernema carpocapsae]
MGAVKKVTKVRLEDYLKLGWYSLLICVMNEVMLVGVVGNIMYMVYAGSSPKILSCGSHDLAHLASPKLACSHLKTLQSNSSCQVELSSEFGSVNKEWNYLCEGAISVKNSISIQMAGIMIGSILFGQMSDMYGRKPTMLVCMFGCAVLNIASSFTHTLVWFTLCRTLIGMLTGGHIVVSIVYIVENLPKQHRFWICTIITWSPNMAIAAGMAYLCGDWQNFARVLGVVVIPGFCLCLYVFESPRFLIRKGNIDEARRVMTGILAFDRTVDYDKDQLDEVLEKEYQLVMQSSGIQNYHLLHVFSTWTFIRYMFAVSFGFFSLSVINYGLLFNMETVSGSLFMNNFYVGIIRWSINLVVAFVEYRTKSLGRKKVHFLGGAPIILCSLFLFIIAVLGKQTEFAMYTRVAIMIVCGVISQLYITNGVVSNELFPTSIRNLAFSFSQFMNRLGAVASPQLFYLADLWTPLPYLTMAVLAILDLVFFEIFVPETKGKSLSGR